MTRQLVNDNRPHGNVASGHTADQEPRRVAAGGICRVGMAGRPTTPLTEPDLWGSHPALWNEFFMVKQSKLTRDQLHGVQITRNVS